MDPLWSLLSMLSAWVIDRTLCRCNSVQQDDSPPLTHSRWLKSLSSVCFLMPVCRGGGGRFLHSAIRFHGALCSNSAMCVASDLCPLPATAEKIHLICVVLEGSTEKIAADKQVNRYNFCRRILLVYTHLILEYAYVYVRVYKHFKFCFNKLIKIRVKSMVFCCFITSLWCVQNSYWWQFRM